MTRQTITASIFLLVLGTSFTEACADYGLPRRPLVSIKDNDGRAFACCPRVFATPTYDVHAYSCCSGVAGSSYMMNSNDVNANPTFSQWIKPTAPSKANLIVCLDPEMKTLVSPQAPQSFTCRNIASTTQLVVSHERVIRLPATSNSTGQLQFIGHPFPRHFETNGFSYESIATGLLGCCTIRNTTYWDCCLNGTPTSSVQLLINSLQMKTWVTIAMSNSMCYASGGSVSLHRRHQGLIAESN